MATKDTTSQAVLQDFIRQFGETPYGSMARARLQELQAAVLKQADKVAVENPAVPPPRATKPCTAIVGRWDWFNGAEPVFKLDREPYVPAAIPGLGRARMGTTSYHGAWEDGSIVSGSQPMARGSTDRTVTSHVPEFASEHSDKMKSLSLTCLQSARCANKIRKSSTGQKGQK